MLTTTVTLTLTIRDLCVTDLPGMSWAGEFHMKQVEAAMAKNTSKDFLAVFLSNGRSVGKGEIDYEQQPGAGQIGSLTVREDMQSLGIGSALITAAEQRIRERGLSRAELDVEEDNPRARSLYERLGYVAYGRTPDSWDQQAPDGTIYRYETTCTLMRKDLT